MPNQKKQIFLWHGENDFDIRQQIKQWVLAFEKKYTGLNIIYLDAKDPGCSNDKLLEELKNSLQVDSLFGSNKLVVLQNFLTKGIEKNQELNEFLIHALEKLSETFFVVFWQTEKPDARVKLFKHLKKLEKTGLVEIKEFKLPRGYELGQWVKARVKHHQGQIEPAAVDLFLALIGNNLWQLDSEICKVVNYKRGEVIKPEDVQLLVKARFNDDIFQLMDALSQKNKAKAIALMQDQLDSGASEMYVFAMLVRQFRLLRQVKELFEYEKIKDQQAIARELSLHPFVVQKIMGQINYFDFKQLRKIYQQLLAFEFSLKTQNTPFRLLFDKFIAVL
jgi:DNA polymerase-3 subunit delta